MAQPSFEMSVVTSHGTFGISAHESSTHGAAEPFLGRARRGFYDGMEFHRLVPNLFIQGGATDTPQGDDGVYTHTDVQPDARYDFGTVALATSSPHRASCQFFICLGDATALDPFYPIVGKVTTGLDVLNKLNGVGTAGNEAPVESIVIESMSVTRD